MSTESATLWAAICVFGALAALDHAAWPSLLLSQPIVAGGIAGLGAGHLEAGLAAGAIAQLLWLTPTPVGGAAVPEAWLAGLAAGWCAPADLQLADLGWLADPRLAPPVVVGVAAAHGGRLLLVVQRRAQRRLAQGLDAELARGETHGVVRLHAMGLALHAGRGVLSAAAVLAAAPAIASALGRIGVAAPAGWLAVAIGAVALAAATPRTRRWVWIAAGALVGLAAAVLR